MDPLKVAQHILAIDGRMTQGLRNNLNKALRPINKQTYFKAIPIGEIMDLMEGFGVVLLQEDSTRWSGFLMGGVEQEQKVVFDLGWAGTKTEEGFFEIIPNASLVLTYYKMPNSGNYEIVVYVS